MSPDRASMGPDSFQNQLNRIIPIDCKDDERYPSEISFLVVAGPAIMEDLGNYRQYKEAFEASLKTSDGRNLIKSQIAFPKSWLDVLPKL